MHIWRYILLIVRHLHHLVTAGVARRSASPLHLLSALPLRGLLLLHVVVGEVSSETTDEDDGVDRNATGGLVGLVVRGRGVDSGGLGDGVVGLSGPLACGF